MLLFSWLKHIARYKWALANLAFLATTEYIPQIDLYKWLNEPFTPPPEEENPAWGGDCSLIMQSRMTPQVASYAKFI